MFNLLKIFATKPVNTGRWPQPAGPADAITNAAAGSGWDRPAVVAAAQEAANPGASGWDHPDVLAAVERAHTTARKTFVDLVDWDALGAVVAEAVVEGFENPTEEHVSTEGIEDGEDDLYFLTSAIDPLTRDVVDPHNVVDPHGLLDSTGTLRLYGKD